MHPNATYLLYQAERPRTRAEVIAADARLGEIAASAARLRRAAAGRARTVASHVWLAAGARRPAWEPPGPGGVRRARRPVPGRQQPS
jgi:hypothetical protein